MSTPSGADQLVAGPPDRSSSSARRPRPAALDDAVVVLGCYLALGVAAAALWSALYDPALFTKAAGGGLGMGEAELAKRFNGDGWYTVIGAVGGLVSGTVLSWWRARDPLLTTGLVLAGSVLAGAVTAVLGGLVGPPDPQSLAGSLAVGDTVPMALGVDAAVCYLVWPVCALVGTLVVLWTPAPESGGSAPPGPVPH